MKKQILILILAFFASTSSTFGQALPGTKPVPLACTFNDPLNPVAGRAYDYAAIINPTGGTSYWYATKSTTFITAGARVAVEIPADGVLIATGATNYRTRAVSPTTPTTTKVTWTSEGLAGIDATHPLFMVVEYAGPTCANNTKVMQILPKVAFTVDITNLTHDATHASLPYNIPESQCYANVAAAIFNAGKMDVDYGTNVLYFEVIGANFTDTYKPTLRLSGLQGAQTATIDWGYTKGITGTNLVTDVAAPGVTTAQFTVTTTESSTADGVSIYVRVTVRNHGWEGLGNDNITLAVEAVDDSATANKDVDIDCITITEFGDMAVQTLNARPTVAAGTPLVPQNP